ncbi:tetratricopeptide (TPR) repeat protein [Agromyces terreus]|uniref:Tetratricopeptide (TPR) repeat protein n=1 Tax=Agromyces terreus TaxID=424795 RepID=A0A9X2KFQ0_9MICO|nr:DUF6880 family protein [Agromyces terreus]MCP2371997.1 tetratricopeptide (TPR) repeat protein [Agromyces terreus]
MPELADAVLPLIRTRGDLYRWSAANAHGRDMHEAIDILESHLATADAADAYAVTHKALASSLKVIARADDSSGIIGDACRRLLDLHPRLAAAASVPPAKLVKWMFAFQLDGDVDYFELDPVAYAPALGERGLKAYRERLEEVRTSIPAKSLDDWRDPHSHERWVLEWNDRRLAVLDRDVEAIIRTHARDRRVAAWLEQTAEALAEIGEIDLAIDWAKQATDFDLGHQSVQAARYWCKLLGEHRPTELIEARRYVFDRWPNGETAANLYSAVGADWPSIEPDIMSKLATNPSGAVSFALHTLHDPQRAWDLAHELDVESDRLWMSVADAYERIDWVATLPVHRRLIEAELQDADARRYRSAAVRLAHLRKLANGTEHAAGVDEFIADLRLVHKRRPRLKQEFDRVRLP